MLMELNVNCKVVLRLGLYYLEILNVKRAPSITEVPLSYQTSINNKRWAGVHLTILMGYLYMQASKDGIGVL
jgi:hypothetical protein